MLIKIATNLRFPCSFEFALGFGAAMANPILGGTLWVEPALEFLACLAKINDFAHASLGIHEHATDKKAPILITCVCANYDDKVARFRVMILWLKTILNSVKASGSAERAAYMPSAHIIPIWTAPARQVNRIVNSWNSDHIRAETSVSAEMTWPV